MHGFSNKQGEIVFGLVQNGCVVLVWAMLFIPDMFCYGTSTFRFPLVFLLLGVLLRRVSRLLFVSPMYVRSCSFCFCACLHVPMKVTVYSQNINFHSIGFWLELCILVYSPYTVFILTSMLRSIYVVIIMNE